MSPHYSTEEAARHLPQNYKNTKLGSEELLNIVRNELKSRGAYEIAGIRCKFRRADKDGDEALNFSEFQRLLTDQLDIHLSEKQQADLFTIYDSDGHGLI